MMQLKNQKPKIKPDQKIIEKIAEENKIERLCPLCDNLKDWFEKNPLDTKPKDKV
jgi:hypothetical protein